MHRAVRHVTTGAASLRRYGGLCRVPVIPSLGNRDLSCPKLNVLLRLLLMVVLLRLLLRRLLLLLLVVMRLVGRLGDTLLLLLLLPNVTAPKTVVNDLRRMIAQVVEGVSDVGILVDVIVGGGSGDRNSDRFDTAWLYHGAIFHFRLSRLQHAHTVLLADLLAVGHICHLLLLLLRLLLLLLLLLADFVLDDVLVLYQFPLLLLGYWLPDGLRCRLDVSDVFDQQMSVLGGRFTVLVTPPPLHFARSLRYSLRVRPLLLSSDRETCNSHSRLRPGRDRGKAHQGTYTRSSRARARERRQ